MSKQVIGGGALGVGIMIGLTEYVGLSGNLNYLWALLVFIWGLKALK